MYKKLNNKKVERNPGRRLHTDTAPPAPNLGVGIEGEPDIWG